MAGHLRALFFVSYGEVTRSNPLVRAAYFATGLGHQAVIVFFVLSGWLISSTVLRDFRARRWSWTSYLTRRLTRLWIVLLPALLLGVLLDRLGMSLFDQQGVYGNSPAYASIFSYTVADHTGVWALLGNALFLQNILVPTYGSNGALWSLAYEFWYYMMFPLLLLSATSLKAWPGRIAAFVGFVAIVTFVGVLIASSFLIWLMGTVALLLAGRSTRTWAAPARVLAIVGCCGAILVALLVARSGLSTIGDFVLGVAFAATLYVIVRSARPEVGPSRFGRSWKSLAAFSYTLYVVHLPLLVFVRAWTESAGVRRWQPDPVHVVVGMALGASVLAFAFGFSCLTERHTDTVRKKLMARIALARAT